MSKLWVLFDTSTKVDYYSDVHTLLSYPQGYYYKYEYRKEYVSQDAISIFANENIKNQEGLIVYCQDKSFIKGGDNQKPLDCSNFLWIAMRLIKLIKVHNDGENYHIYFEVLDYPKVSETDLITLLNPIIKKNEVPFAKYVSVLPNSTIPLVYNNDDAWKSIVNTFDGDFVQYRGDSFYRIKSIKTKKSNPVEFTYEDQNDRIKPGIKVTEGERIILDIESYEPRDSVDHKGFCKSIEILSNNSEEIRVVGRQKLSLRQYNNLSVELDICNYQHFSDRSSFISLNSMRLNEEWPNGAELVLGFNIKKNKLKLFTQVFLYFVSLVIYCVNTFCLTDTDLIAKAMFTVILGVILIIAQLIGTGKIPTIFK